jgi:hypothetical protein
MRGFRNEGKDLAAGASIPKVGSQGVPPIGRISGGDAASTMLSSDAGASVPKVQSQGVPPVGRISGGDAASTMFPFDTAGRMWSYSVKIATGVIAWAMAE